MPKTTRTPFIVELTSFGSTEVRGGPVAVVRLLADGFSRAQGTVGWTVVAAVPRAWPQATMTSANRPRDLPPSLRNLARLAQVVRVSRTRVKSAEQLMREELGGKTPQLIHAHDIYAFAAAEKTFSRARSAGRLRIILSIHSPGATMEELRLRSRVGSPGVVVSALWRALRAWERKLVKRADLLVFPSLGSSDIVFRDLGIERGSENVAIMYNGVPPLNLGNSALRSALGIPQDAFVIGSVGRFVQEKGHDVAIRAFCEARGTLANAYLLLVGRGPEQRKLARLANELLESESFRILPEVSSMADFMGSLDLFVSCNRRSAFDLLILEAMSAGLPILATRVGGNPEALGRDDLLVASEDYAGLAQKLVALASDGPMRAAISSYLRDRFNTHFTTDRMITEAAKIYRTQLRALSTVEVWDGR